MKMMMKAVAHECGSCTLCCKVLAIKDDILEKPKDTWCPHAIKGAGCGIYEVRPNICRGFKCLWLSGQFGGPENRPDKLHAVVIATTDRKNWVIIEDPGYPGFARAKLKSVIDGYLAQDPHNYVIIATGRNRAFLGNRWKYDELMAAGVSEVADK